MKNTLLIALVIWASSCTSTKKNNTNNQTSMSTQNTTTQSKSFYDFSIATLDENGAINMADYKGKKILIVNVGLKMWLYSTIRRFTKTLYRTRGQITNHWFSM